MNKLDNNHNNNINQLDCTEIAKIGYRGKKELQPYKRITFINGYLEKWTNPTILKPAL